MTRLDQLRGCVFWIFPFLVFGCSRSKPEDKLPTQPTRPAVTDAAKKAEAPSHSSPSLGEQLYARHCAACHGENGDGNGPAARYLYPKPRNFRSARFRLVTTSNLVASDEDLLHVITRGMPGSAMFPFGHLSESDGMDLVSYVRLLARKGIEEQLRQEFAEFGDEVDPDELAQEVARITEPGATLQLPDDWPAVEDESATRGREVYVKIGCVSCHGETGRGDGVEEQRDIDGTPTRPRDFTRGIFKGGRDDLQLYARIALGMPGTPMPASPTLKPSEIGDLVHYVQSLSEPAAQARVLHQRQRLVARRAGQTLPEQMADEQWEAAEAVHIVASPLWWRDYLEPDLHVQALHDGTSLAIRVTWQDATLNSSAVRAQDFEDMVAVQLFQGKQEPFLGMGAIDGSVDVWLWQAGWQADLSEYADVDSVYPDMAVDLYPLETGDGTRHLTERQPKEFITALASGNLRSDPARDLAGSHLSAEGFGTLTMRPRVSQIVKARGERNEGRWTVVFRRTLQPTNDDSLRLDPGEKLSITFAVWDGAVADRDGKKLVSIWHDLELE